MSRAGVEPTTFGFGGPEGLRLFYDAKPLFYQGI